MKPLGESVGASWGGTSRDPAAQGPPPWGAAGPEWPELLARAAVEVEQQQQEARPHPCPPTLTYLPHEVVVLADVHMFRGDDSASEGAHLCARLDPRLGEDAEALAGDGTLRDNHLSRQHQAGELLHLYGRGAGALGQSLRTQPILPGPPIPSPPQSDSAEVTPGVCGGVEGMEPQSPGFCL